MGKGKVFNRKKTMKAVIWGIIAAAVFYAVWANATIISFSGSYIIGGQDAKTKEAQCILVLGAQVNGGQPGQILKNRLDCGIELYRQGCSPKLLLTGDGGANVQDEISVMKKYALDAGVPAQDIFVDREGFDTYDSMYRAKAVFGLKRILVVTQDFHLSRSVYIAHAFGIDAFGVSAQPADNMLFWEIREIGARCKDFLTSWFKPPIPMHGLPIFIGGDGRVTQ